jgi:hypothetical protein
MKKVFSNSQACHVWAQQKQDEGRGHNIFFEKEAIYSYGRHFCVAMFISPKVVLLNDASYSHSTSRHQSYVRSALRGLDVVTLHVPVMGNSRSDVQENVQIMLNRIDTGIETVDNSITSAEWKINSLSGNVESLDEYLKHCKGATKKQLARLTQLRKIIDHKSAEVWPEKIKLQDEKDRVRRENAEKIRAEKQRIYNLKCQANVPLWLKGEIDSRYEMPDDVTYLRIKDDKVQTSRGAEVPLSEAKVLLGLWMKRELQVGYKIGHFEVEEVSKDQVKIGCHYLVNEEIARIAPQLVSA